MEIIALILIIVFAVLGNATKKGAQPRRGTTATGRPAAPGAAAPARAAARPAQSAAQPAQPAQPKVRPPMTSAEQDFESTLTELRDLLVVGGKAPAEGDSMLADEDCHGGSMPHAHTEGHSELADEECFGGSMAHGHSEGVSRADHARRMAAIDAKASEGLVPAASAIDAAALRRAVVMAEVLGRPRALRRAGRPG